MANSNFDWVSRGVRNKEHFFARAGMWVTEANETERHLSNTLIAVGTVFIGITSPLVSDLQQLSEGQKVVIFFSWVLAVASIVFGLIQVFGNMRFFADNGKIDNDQEGLWSEITFTKEQYQEINKKSKNLSKKMKVQSSFTFLYLQIGSLLVAILLAMLIGSLVFFTGSSGKTGINSKEIHCNKYGTTQTHCRFRHYSRNF